MRVVYFVTETGRKPVEEFVEGLSQYSKRKFVQAAELLEHYGKDLPYPRAKYIGNEIHELRFESIEGALRVLYFFFDGDKAVLTNGFVKKSNKTPKIEKELAVKRREIYFLRHRGGF